MCQPRFGKLAGIFITAGLGYTRFHVVVVEALTQHGMIPKSPPNIYQALDNVHMLWMGTAINHNAVTNTCVNPDVGSPLKFHITAVWQRMTLCCGWGSYPTWNQSHIPSHHMKGSWQLSYAVNGLMGPLSCQYHYMCWPRCGCGKSAGFFITACPGQHKMPLCCGWGS